MFHRGSGPGTKLVGSLRKRASGFVLEDLIEQLKCVKTLLGVGC